MLTEVLRRLRPARAARRPLLSRVFPRLERLGFHLTRNHFYEPVPDVGGLPPETFEAHSELPGLELREQEQLALLERITHFREEYSQFPERLQRGGARYFQRNLQFERVDAEVLHALIRIGRPRRIVEVGAGYSTLVAAAAIGRNQGQEPGMRCELVSIDPEPPEFLRDLPGLSRLIPAKVQELPIELLTSLGGGDILFIDSSHVLKIGSDVQYLYLEVLPRLAPGVLVQIHDVFFPTDYPRGFVVEWHRFWTEQYLLQAFLAFNREFQVLWSSSLMAHRHQERLREAFPGFDRGGMWPSSLWMRRR